VFARAPDREVRREVRFHEASELTPDHWHELQPTVQRRVLRYFHRHGLLDEDATTDMLTWQGSGGFSIDASVRIDGHDRVGIERLVRYCARPPFALERLHACDGIASLVAPEARLRYRLPKPDMDSRTELLLTPFELLERLTQFVPPPRVHRHRYHGVLAPNASLRSPVVAIGRPGLHCLAPESAPESDVHTDVHAAPPGGAPETTPASSAPARIRWAQLLERIYEVLPLLCPACGGEMKILAFLTDPPVLRAILVHLDLPDLPPPISSARAPPQTDLLLDQTPEFDPTEPEPAPELTFDQSLPDELDFDA